MGELNKVFSAFQNSLKGLFYTIKNERAFRQELLVLFFIVIPIIFLLELSLFKALVLVASYQIIFIAELLNTAIEILCDKVEKSHCKFIEHSKDVASAAVFMAMIFHILVWIMILKFS